MSQAAQAILIIKSYARIFLRGVARLVSHLWAGIARALPVMMPPYMLLNMLRIRIGAFHGGGRRPMTNSRHEIFFLQFEFPSDLGGEFRRSLAMVKISEEIPLAYLAFQTQRLAQLAADAMTEVSVIAASELDARRYLGAPAVKVVLFKSEEEIRDYRFDRVEYPYELSLYNFSAEDGLSRLSV